MKAARTKLRMKSGIGSESTNPIVMVVPSNGNVRSKAERAKLVYLWVGDGKQCFAHVSGAKSLRRLALAILAEVGTA